MAQVQKRQPASPAERSDWLARWFGGEWPFPRWMPEVSRAFGEGAQLPRLEEFVDGNEVVIRAELPGIDPDRDVEVTVSDHSLRLRAERRHETQVDGKDGYRSEFSYGLFERSIPLPAGVSEQDVKASYRDGILEVRVPVDRQRAESKKVPIQRV